MKKYCSKNTAFVCSHCDQTNKSHKMLAYATMETPFMGIASNFTICMGRRRKGGKKEEEDKRGEEEKEKGGKGINAVLT